VNRFYDALHPALPIFAQLDKRAYRDQPQAFIARDVARHRLYRGKTSGTTGTALPLWYTLEALAEEYAAVWRMRRVCGVRKSNGKFRAVKSRAGSITQ
jgi:phenylacetate-coenzyme A ligase PaaK-like adenylate-forming protein